MFSKIGNLLFEKEAVARTSDFRMGLEIEMDRADETGHLSKEPYPDTIGDAHSNPWITEDFLIAMSEVVTPPADSPLDAMHYLYRINNALRNALAPGEILWPLSMPPIMPKNKTNDLITDATPEKREFLVNWVKLHHGMEKALPCGAHINLSIHNHVIKLIQSEMSDQFKTEQDVKDYLYMRLGQGFVRYRWIITYLFGASPIAEANYYDHDKGPDQPIRSLRQTNRYGYGAKFLVDYTSIDKYIASIHDAVKKKLLVRASEGQGPIRFRGGKDLDDLRNTGIQYLELRMLDLDPTSEIGIKTNTIRFIRVMASYFIMNPPLKQSTVNEALTEANRVNDEVASEHPNHFNHQVQARSFLRRLQLFVDQIQAGPEYDEVLQEMEMRVEHPELTPSAQLVKQIKNGSLVDYAVKTGMKYQQSALVALRPFDGFDTTKQPTSEELKKYLFRNSFKS
ncbi:glutamate--cysteine ligase (plasmid) [Nicoliella spurrieriana]|uniref:Glutamate--cysteine ligase n=1 Tax=Nicoliella spurrieriana TaxID=2925830 RepID=A0A976X4V8_9LACO|nr:glutamate--cysteine ligase [Nicoliella spurrieriana]UQS85922.1 glutamate--cysteine ligase [Nicoliella spurrieriana]